MAWATTKGFCFRATSGYVTDPTNTTYVAMEAYPTTRSVGGENVTFGWNDVASHIDSRDRSTSAPYELAGLNFLDSADTKYFRVDVPAAGAYRFQLAVGDRGGNACTPNVIVKDGVGGSTLATVQQATPTAGGAFVDAAGTEHASAAAWDASGRVWSGSLTLTGTVIAFYVTNDATYTSPNLAFVNIEQVASTGGLLLLASDGLGLGGL